MRTTGRDETDAGPTRIRFPWATLVFLIGFAVLLVFISYWYLFPALEAARDATRVEKKGLAAHARLLLAVVLFILFAGLVLTFRIGRFFFPRATPRRHRTEYVDAWAESGRRIDLKSAEDEE